MSTQTFTAPKAYITIENQVAGYIRNISFTENIQRTDIRGLGNLYAIEVPAVSANNTFNVDMFFIDFSLPAVKKLLNRLGGTEALINTLSLGDLPISINIYKREIFILHMERNLFISFSKATRANTFYVCIKLAC